LRNPRRKTGEKKFSKGLEKRITFLEKVHPGPVASHIEIVLQEPRAFHPKLGEVIPTVIAKEQDAARLEHLEKKKKNKKQRCVSVNKR
jgi:hypothetical protein